MMDMFDHDERYTDTASEFESEVYAALSPIFDKWNAEGAKLRELSYITTATATMIELSLILDKTYDVSE